MRYRSIHNTHTRKARLRSDGVTPLDDHRRIVPHSLSATTAGGTRAAPHTPLLHSRVEVALLPQVEPHSGVQGLPTL